ncbi:MAG: AarF/ABC1/UbiB kinase family protein [Pseudomonadota bacterium]
MSEQESDSFSQRLKRYAKVSTKLTYLVTQLAGHYVGTSLDRPAHALALKTALGDLKGPIMKIAQLLSTIPDALPEEYAKELAHLQSQAPSMGWPFVNRRMKAELGPDWQTKFAFFEHTAAAAASLGQVHKAQDLQNHTLACKLQYPNMSAVVEADLKQLKILLKLYETYDKAVRTSYIYPEIAARIREELDYNLEAKHIQLYQTMLQDEPTIHVPNVIPELSTKRLLSMTWLAGEPLMQAKQRSLDARNQIARNMFRAWYVPFYNYGIIHGDPHLGNYTIPENNSVNLLDFGCIRVFPSTLVQGVIDLYFALQNNDQERAIHAYESWGFDNISKELIEVLNGWAKFLYGPILEDRIRPIDENQSGIYGREVAGKVHAALREIGGVSPPAEFVFMDRAAIGLGSVFLHLKAEINWYQEFHGLIRGFDKDAMARKQQKILRQVELSA